MVYTGVLSALSIVLFLFLEFPVIPGGSLKIDASDVPAAVAGVMMGPGAAVAVEFVKILIHLIVRGVGDTMGFGDLMNLIVGVALTVPFSIVYRSMSKHGVNAYLTILAAGVSGMASMSAAGVIGNYFIAPPYFEFYVHIKLTSAALWAYIGSATILNVLKSALVSVVMLPVIKVFKKRFAQFQNQ